MIVDKEIVSKIPRDYIFITGGFDLDPKYLKQRIEEGVKESNLNYKTNVVGKHTEWKFFNNDKHFITLLLQLIDHIENLNIEFPHLSIPLFCMNYQLNYKINLVHLDINLVNLDLDNFFYIHL